MPKQKKVKVEKVPKQKKVKAEKVAKGGKKSKTKTKINFRNYKSTNSMIITTIFVFRIVMVAFLFTYPFVFALTPVFDSGTKQLMFYTVESIPAGITNFFSFGSLVSGTESITRFVPYMFWMLSGFLVLVAFFAPFFGSKTKGSKGFLAFYYMLLGGIGIGIIYALQFLLIDMFPHVPFSMDNWSERTQKDIYWDGIHRLFSFDSFWMILNQIFHCVSIVFGIWCAIESDLIRRKKLKYSDILTNINKANSLANKVLQGHLEFGNVSDEDLRLSVHKLKSKLNIDEMMNDEQRRKEFEEEKSRAQEIEQVRSEQEHDSLQNEIKEAV